MHRNNLATRAWRDASRNFARLIGPSGISTSGGLAGLAWLIAMTLAAEELMQYVAARVAPYKKIRAVEFVQEIPKSLSGKILRRILKEKVRAHAHGNS